MRDFIFVHRKDPENIGDIASCIAAYLRIKTPDVVDIVDPDLGAKVRGRKVVLGGGGLISPFFAPYLGVLRANASELIGWGIGIHAPQEKKIDGDIRGVPVVIPHDVFACFKALGIRDKIDVGAHHWVACPSVLHPVFKQCYFTEIRHEVVIYSHRRMPIHMRGVPCLTNQTSFEEVIRFLLSANTVITNSYHGALWALLFGRDVIVIPWCIKLMTLGPPVKYIAYRELETTVPKTVVVNREADRQFYRDCVNSHKAFLQHLRTRLQFPFDLKPV